MPLVIFWGCEGGDFDLYFGQQSMVQQNLAVIAYEDIVARRDQAVANINQTATAAIDTMNTHESQADNSMAGSLSQAQNAINQDVQRARNEINGQRDRAVAALRADVQRVTEAMPGIVASAQNRMNSQVSTLVTRLEREERRVVDAARALLSNREVPGDSNPSGKPCPSPGGNIEVKSIRRSSTWEHGDWEVRAHVCGTGPEGRNLAGIEVVISGDNGFREDQSSAVLNGNHCGWATVSWPRPPSGVYPGNPSKYRMRAFAHNGCIISTTASGRF